MWQSIMRHMQATAEAIAPSQQCIRCKPRTCAAARVAAVRGVLVGLHGCGSGRQIQADVQLGHMLLQGSEVLRVDTAAAGMLLFLGFALVVAPSLAH